MLNENAKKWVAALRSGRFQQTQNKLTRTQGGQIIGCCCLGVACELALEAGINLAASDDGFVKGYGSKDNYTTTSLPAVVREWLGLADRDGRYQQKDVTRARCLTADNDGGASFSQIADIIESEPEGLFV